MQMLRSFLRLAVLTLIALWLGGCSQVEAYRYKLTLAISTPDGVIRGSSVVEVAFRAVSVPARGVMHRISGEALYLDLGFGRRPLIALLTSRLHPKYGKELRWTFDAGPGDNLLGPLFGVALQGDLLDYASRLARVRGARRIEPTDLPDLVTFANVNDPKSVVEVDASDLQATLGPGVAWHEITLEITDEPITAGIAMKLPWLPKYFDRNLRLDGSDHGPNVGLANILSWPDFDQSSDLRRSK